MHRFWPTVIQPVLRAPPPTIVEVGVDQGANTRKVLEYVRDTGAVLHGVDPAPKIPAEDWEREFGDAFVLHRRLSLDVLPELETADVVLLDGDHNWYTVHGELQAIRARPATTAGRSRGLPARRGLALRSPGPVLRPGRDPAGVPAVDVPRSRFPRDRPARRRRGTQPAPPPRHDFRRPAQRGPDGHRGLPRGRE